MQEVMAAEPEAMRTLLQTSNLQSVIENCCGTLESLSLFVAGVQTDGCVVDRALCLG